MEWTLLWRLIGYKRILKIQPSTKLGFKEVKLERYSRLTWYTACTLRDTKFLVAETSTNREAYEHNLFHKMQIIYDINMTSHASKKLSQQIYMGYTTLGIIRRSYENQSKLDWFDIKLIYAANYLETFLPMGVNN